MKLMKMAVRFITLFMQNRNKNFKIYLIKHCILHFVKIGDIIIFIVFKKTVQRYEIYLNWQKILPPVQQSHNTLIHNVKMWQIA